ncbi:hypothetical protein BDF22DRAFT_671473 [Syncephalis plumigaleata]|nr:hypothetical protein BDF22DRAFT_671473 [Syncephalis plumigaleata]
MKLNNRDIIVPSFATEAEKVIHDQQLGIVAIDVNHLLQQQDAIKSTVVEYDDSQDDCETDSEDESVDSEDTNPTTIPGRTRCVFPITITNNQELVLPAGQRAEWKPSTATRDNTTYLAIANLHALIPAGIFASHSIGPLKNLRIQLVNLLPNTVSIPVGTQIAELEVADDVILKSINTADDLRIAIQDVEAISVEQQPRIVAAVEQAVFTENDFLERMDSDLSNARQQQLLSLLLRNTDLFAHNSMEFGRTHLAEHNIELTDPTPVRCRPYRYGPPSVNRRYIRFSRRRLLV